MAGAGFGLKLTDLARGSDHHAAFRTWWAFGRGAYMGLDQDGPPQRVTMYYDPLREVHHRNPVSGAMGRCAECGTQFVRFSSEHASA